MPVFTESKEKPRKVFFLPFQIVPLQAISIVICNSLSFSLDLLFISLISFVVTPHIYNNRINGSFFIVFLIIFGKFLLGILEIKLDLSGKKQLFKKISIELSSINKVATSRNHLNRLVSRDIMTLADQFFLLIEPIKLIVEANLLILVGYFVAGNAGIIGLMGVCILFPVSFLIGKFTYYYTEKLFKRTEYRIDLTVQWLSYRKLAFLMQLQDKALDKIRKAFLKEIYFRNMDSLLRSLELYLSIFSRPIPMIFASLIIFTGFDLRQNVLTVFWLSIPAIDLVLRAGRTLATFKVCQSCFDNIECFLSETAEQQDLRLKKTVYCDDDWDIWDGSLKENLCDRGKLPDLLTDLRLDREFMRRGSKTELIELEHFAKNISQGQRTRILFGRAINHLLELSSGILYLELSLNSLDRDSKLRIANIIDRLPTQYTVNLSHENELLFSNLSLPVPLEKDIDESNTNWSINNSDNQQKDGKDSDVRSLTKAIFSLTSWYSLLLLFPAFLLGWFGQKTSEVPHNFQTIMVWILAILAGVCCASAAGWLIENKIRNSALESYMKLITRRGIRDETDLKQRIIVDTSVMIERLSWYIHDLSWMLCVLIMTCIGLLWAKPLPSTGLIVFYFSLALLAWSFFAKSIEEGRRKFVEGVNSALYKLENVLCFKGVEYSIATQRRKEFSHEAFELIYGSVSALAWSKGVFAQSFVFLAGLLLVGVYGAYEYGIFQKPEFLFLMSLVLTVQAQSSNFVLALSGFNSQRNSLDRLQGYDLYPTLIQESPVVNYQNSEFLIPKRLSLNTLNTSEFAQIPMGKISSLVGQSGSGKSIYLQIIAGVELPSDVSGVFSKEITTQVVPCIYLDRKAVDLFAWSELLNSKEDFTPDFLFSFIMNKISFNQYTLIILDEILTLWNETAAQHFCRRLEENLEKLCVSVILVDHRFSMPSYIKISAL
jgi:ABC-type iron transport system FetAB ATPase subunit